MRTISASGSGLLLLFGAVLPAQTFIVDAANGPGANFTDVAAAIAAAPDGAVLVVRPGSYSPFTIDGKGVAVLGTTGVIVASSTPAEVLVQNTAVGQAVILRALQLSNVRFRADGCAGLVDLDEVVTAPGSGRSWAQNCGRIALSGCTVFEGLHLEACDAVLAESTVHGAAPSSIFVGGSGHCVYATYPGTPGVSARGGSLAVRGGSIEGAGAATDPCFTITYGPYPAIAVDGTAVRVLDGALIAGSSGLLQPRNGPLLSASATGSFRIDPETVFVQDPGGVVGTPFVPEVMPSLVTHTAPLGGVLTATVRDPIGDLAVVLLGLPGPPVFVAGAHDPFWLHASSLAFAAIGQAPLTATQSVPNLPALLGFPLGWQAVTFDATTTAVRVSNPGIGLVR